MLGAICLPSWEPPSAVLDALVRLFAVQGVGGAQLLRGFPAELGPGAGAGSALGALAVLPPCPGSRSPASRAGLCSEFHVHGKQLGFRLSRFVNKRMRSRSSWLGLWTRWLDPGLCRQHHKGAAGGEGTAQGDALPSRKVWVGEDALVSQVKGSPPQKDRFPSVLTAGEWWLVTGGSSALAWFITFPEVSLSYKGWRLRKALKDLEEISPGKGQGAGQDQEVSQQPRVLQRLPTVRCWLAVGSWAELLVEKYVKFSCLSEKDVTVVPKLTGHPTGPV